MNLILNLIVNIIIVSFPTLIYHYYLIYNKNMKKEKSKIALAFASFLSLFLTISLESYIPTEFQFANVILPLIICYLNKKPNICIIMSIILLEYSYTTLNINLISLLIFFIILYLIYHKYYRTTKTSYFFINYGGILFTLVELINIFPNYTLNNLIDVLINAIIYFVSTYIINYSYHQSKNILNMHMTLKEFEKDKDIKTNLFKITHEIKNPLAVIKGYLDMFNVTDQIKSERYVNILKGEVNRTLNLLEDFMEFTKINVQKNKFEINKLIDDTKEVVIPYFISSNISYNFECQNNITINADYNRLKQVIINIIKNAVEACPENKGLVSTTIFKDNDYLFIFVKDNGSGMDKETIENMLVPFYTTKEKGTGLGVSLSKEIIESHGGNISYKSIINKGTTCKITIPLN